MPCPPDLFLIRLPSNVQRPGTGRSRDTTSSRDADSSGRRAVLQLHCVITSRGRRDQTWTAPEPPEPPGGGGGGGSSALPEPPAGPAPHSIPTGWGRARHCCVGSGAEVSCAEVMAVSPSLPVRQLRVMALSPILGLPVRRNGRHARERRKVGGGGGASGLSRPLNSPLNCPPPVPPSGGAGHMPGGIRRKEFVSFSRM